MRRGFEEKRISHRRHEADTLTVLVFSVWTFPAKSRPFWIAQLQIAIMGYSWANINLPPEHPIIAILKNTILNGRPPYRRTDLPIARRRPRLQSYKSARYGGKHWVLIWWLKRRTAKRVALPELSSTKHFVFQNVLTTDCQVGQTWARLKLGLRKSLLWFC